jgi:hypothetical protein
VIVGGPISVAAGLLVATVALVVIASTGGSKDGGYCSQFGEIGRYETLTPGKMVEYRDEGWSGFPPSQSCSVFLIDSPYESPPPAVKQGRRDEPDRLLAHGTYPGSRGRLWIVGLLVLPPATWGLLVIAAALRRRRASALQASLE